jgi:hypothetical protein
MSRLLERLLLWFADLLDRSLLAVPEVDDEWPPPVGRSGEHALVASTARPPGRGHHIHSSASNPSNSESHCK